MKHKIKVKYMDREFVSYVERGTNLLEHIRGLDVHIDTPCGGNGTCGKCRIKLISSSQISEKEARLLGAAAVKNGYRLACYQNIESDLDVLVEGNSLKGMIMTTVHDIDAIADPNPTIKHINIEKPSLSDQRANLDRILEAADLCLDELDIDVINKINTLIRNEKTDITAVAHEGQLLDVMEGWVEKIYSLAVDIGTTTVAVYLVDTLGARIADVESFYNPQKKYGADIISRIDYINRYKDISLLNKPLMDELNKAALKLTERNGISADAIYSAYFVGNTTMIHILLMLDPKGIANAPFIPQTTCAHTVKAIDMGLDINRKGIVCNIPMVSGYIGADTVGAVLSSGMYKNDEISLLLDLGTNGEIVAGSCEHLISCSAAAGPAFEGANITNGMAGIPGAIDKIEISDGDVKFSTIGNEKPKGICGSAIIDMTAELINSGLVDETGRFRDAEEIEGTGLIKRRIRIEGMEAFIIYEDDETNEKIVMTQKDIREVQNAKAAIAAGMKVLIKKAGIRERDIKKMYLAGGFGSFVNIKNAARIGLIPKSLESAVVSIGNAAGAGAVLCSVSDELYKKASEIAGCIDYIELSSNPEFTGHFMEEMIFE